MPKPYRLPHRPSGFWMSNAPAQGGAYRYDKLLIGVGVAMLTAVSLWLLLRHYGRRAA